MIKNIQRLGTGQRFVIFTLIFGGGLMAIILLFVVLIRGALNERSQAVPLLREVSVQQFAALPDDDAYPASIALAPDGKLYTASYATGTIWAIALDGTVSEVPGTRDALGSVTGLTVAPDGTIFVIDRLSSDYRLAGGIVRRVSPDGTVSDFATITDQPFSLPTEGGAGSQATPEVLDGLISPDDITLDSIGRIYLTDRTRQQIWRFEPDGSGGVAWWTAGILSGAARDARPEPTGLAYDPLIDAILVADAGMSAIYRIPTATGESELIYQHTGAQEAPQFDGLTIAPDGTIYAAALGLNRVARIVDGELEYLAGGFRGGSDLVYNPVDGGLYVTNFDSASLVAPAVYERRLPFALDVIRFIAVETTPEAGN